MDEISTKVKIIICAVVCIICFGFGFFVCTRFYSSENVSNNGATATDIEQRLQSIEGKQQSIANKLDSVEKGIDDSQAKLDDSAKRLDAIENGLDRSQDIANRNAELISEFGDTIQSIRASSESGESTT